MKKLIAIDGNSLMHRAYYAIQTAMTSRDGVPTNALHGFIMMLVKLIEQRPDYMLVAFDMPGGTFRHDTYSGYKAGRKDMPEDLSPQFPILKALLGAMGIAVCECYKYEADDILGTFAQKAEELGVHTMIVTGDRDALQLINGYTNVMLTKKGISETVIYDEDALMRDYGLTPAHMVDLKALMGDSSDAIPGIKGIGEKTAKALLNKYGDLDGVLSNAMNEKGALQKKLVEGVESARMSYEIGTICKEAPIDMGVEDCGFSVASLSNGVPLLSQYGLRANIARLKALADAEGGGRQSGETREMPEIEAQTSYANIKANKSVIVTDDAELALAIDEIGKAKLMAFHMEESVTILTDKGVLYDIRTGGDLLQQGLSPYDIFAAINPLLINEGIKKVVFDGKKLMTTLSRYKAELKGLAFDITVADYIVNALNPAKTLAALKETMGVTTEGAEAVMQLYSMINAQLTQKGMGELYYGVELPLVSVLYDMEKTGFAVDAEVLRTLGKSMGDRIELLEKQAYEMAGHKFNILSPKQLGAVLFEELKLPPQRKTKTGYSTDADVLETLSGMDPIIDVITEYRFLTKLKSTFIDAMLTKIGGDGRIHTTLNQNVTATGRISSTEPNLQNIPVRTPLGREIRRAFVASSGNMLVGADYSQIELRVLAHISNDEALKDAFISGGDIHTRTAAEVFGVSQEEVTREMRSAAKAVNFGIVYGISEFGLASQLGIPRYKAGEYIKKYLERCTGVRDYMQNSIESGRQNGYAATILGRRRDLPELKSGNYNTRSFGERVAMNMPVQGSAADIIKLAMVRVHEQLSKGGYRAKLVLQIHDELIIDCPINELEQVGKLLHDCMTGNGIADSNEFTSAVAAKIDLSVPLVADVATGHSWFDTK